MSVDRRRVAAADAISFCRGISKPVSVDRRRVAAADFVRKPAADMIHVSVDRRRVAAADTEPANAIWLKFLCQLIAAASRRRTSPKVGGTTGTPRVS